MGEYPHCGSCQQKKGTFSGHNKCVCTHARIHSWDLPECVYLCADSCEACLRRCGVIVLLSTVLRMSVCRGLPSVFRCTHQRISVCIRICLCVSESPPASSQIQLGPSYLQSFLSCVRSLRARIVQNFLQSFPQHRYRSKGDIDTASQKCLFKISRKESWGPEGTGTVTVVGRVGPPICLVGRAIRDGAGVHTCSSHRWQVSTWGVSAYYSISDHVVVFPAGLLQPPFFHPGYPR